MPRSSPIWLNAGRAGWNVLVVGQLRIGRPCAGKMRKAPWYPDAGAVYAAEYHYDAAALETFVACPHSMDNVTPLSQIAGTRMQQAFLGTCTNGRLEDLAAAAAVMRGQQVAPGVRFMIIPASSQVLSAALRAGYIQTFVEAVP